MSNTNKALNVQEPKINTHSMEWSLTVNDLSYVRSRGNTKVLTNSQGKTILFESVQEWLVGCFWPFSYIYIIN